MTGRSSISKLFSDAMVIAGMHLQTYKREWGAWIFILIFPLTMLFFANHASAGAEVSGARLVAGTLVLSLGFAVVSDLSKTLTNERFNKQLQLIVVSPVHRFAYIGGTLSIAGIRGLISAMILVLVAPLLGFDIDFSLWVIPASLLTATALVGLAVVIGTWAPTQQLGNMMAELLGILVVMVSPIFFSADRFPDWLRWLPELSPYTHSADALTEALSGSVATTEVLILTTITTVTLLFGLKAMRWRDV